MVKYGMTPLAALQADLLNGAKLLGWEGQIGALKPGYFADIDRRARRSAQRHLRAAKSLLRDEGRSHLPKIAYGEKSLRRPNELSRKSVLMTSRKAGLSLRSG